MATIATGLIAFLTFVSVSTAERPLCCEHLIHHYEYGYNAAGNRTQVLFSNGAGLVDGRSYMYEYDRLRRLVGAHLGPFEFNAGGYLVGASFSSYWSLDILGNWSEGDNFFGGRTDYDDSTRTMIATLHEVDATNRILAVDDGGGSQPFKHDPNGNLVFDGAYFYQYDAWNRLIEVDDVGTLTAADFTADGQVDTSTTGHSAGGLVMQMVYDGLGRLMEVRRPAATQREIEAYYYDGVRRVQTVIGNHVLPEVIQWHTDREYIYSPGYVDEFVAQVADPAGVPQLMYMLQDANYNVMALLGVPQSGQAPPLLAEYTYDPYGQPVYTNEPGLGNGTWNTVGHQGLFFYAFASGGSPMAVGAPGLYYNRNRWYSPRLGRFTSIDPNETAAPIAGALLMNAASATVPLEALDPAGHYGEGMNLYQYQRSSPQSHSDPLGLNVMDDYDIAIQSLSIEYYKTNRVIETVQSNVQAGLRLAGLYMRAAFAWDDLVWTRDEQLLMDLMLGGFAANACFEASTLVWMADGSFRRIDEICAGDAIMAEYDPVAGSGPEACRVVATSRRSTDELIRLTVNTGGSTVAVLVTPEHPFFVRARKAFVPVVDIQLGDILFDELSCTNALVVGSERLDVTIDVYNIEVEGAHTYYVSGTSAEAPLRTRTAFLVHNVCSLADLKRIAKGHAWTKHIKDWVRLGPKQANAPGHFA